VTAFHQLRPLKHFEEKAMTRSIIALMMLLLAAVALAAPVPTPQPFKTGWDKPVDPDKDCKFTRDKDSLTIELPGTDHDYYPLRDRVNAPRLLRDIEGDFDIQVRVRMDRRPSATSTVKGQPSLVSGGFLLIPPKTYGITCIRLEFGVAGQGDDTNGYAALKHQDTAGGRSDARWGREWKDWSLPEKADRAYLRLVRRGEKLYPSISPDGEKWALLMGGQYGRLPAKLKVGLAAYSTSAEPAKVRFDQFKLIQGQKKKR
jgi:regulation of enolase protein 1 (concanavalin A-like superfamily)